MQVKNYNDSNVGFDEFFEISNIQYYGLQISYMYKLLFTTHPYFSQTHTTELLNLYTRKNFSAFRLIISSTKQTSKYQFFLFKIFK